MEALADRPISIGSPDLVFYVSRVQQLLSKIRGCNGENRFQVTLCDVLITESGNFLEDPVRFFDAHSNYGNRLE